MTVRVEPASRAGHALIHLPGAAAAAARPEFGIRRDEDWGEDKLGPNGWQTSDATLSPDRAEVAGADLVLHVGWSVCRHLESGVYTISVPAGGIAAASMQWPHIQPEHAGSRDVFSPAPPLVADAAPPPPVQASVEPKRAEPREPEHARQSRVPLLIGAVVVLAAAAGLAVWQPWKTASVPDEAPAALPAPPVVTPAVPPSSPPSSPPPSPPAAAVPTLGDMSVADVLAKAPNVAAITEEGQRRLAGNRHDDGLLLLEAAADRGDAAAAAALGKLYDPVGFQPGGPIPKPDPRQAARYYRDAARAGADVAAARDALHGQLERSAQGGDLGAGLTLKDFWP